MTVFYIFSIALHIIAVSRAIPITLHKNCEGRMVARLSIITGLMFIIVQTDWALSGGGGVSEWADIGWLLFDWSNAMTHVVFVTFLSKHVLQCEKNNS